MEDGNQQQEQKPARHNTILAAVLFSFVFGFLGGFLAYQVLEDNSSLSDSETQQVVLQESQLIAKIAEEVSPSVVSINVETVSGEDIFGRQFAQTGAGTGVIISSDGLIITNKHVVPEGTQNLEVIMSDGTSYENVEVVGRDPFNDIAYLQINDVSDLPAAELGDSDDVVVGQKVVAIGNALGEFDNTVTSGIISGIGRPVVAGDSGGSTSSLSNLFQTDAAINPGNSGGPLLNINGEVIGINTAVAGNAENIGFAIPINDAKSGITSIQEKGRLIRPYLGVRYISLDPQIAQELGVTQTEGAYLGSSNGAPAVSSNSPADKAGLEDGDIITKVNDDAVTEDNQLVSLIGRYQVGETVKLTVIRDGEEITLEAVLEEAPANP